MLWTAKITSRGRVTLPQGLRERMGWQPGDRVTFVVRGETVILKPCEGILDWYGALEGQSQPEDLDAVREAVRRAIAEKTIACSE
jgi:AbrB family looped-hinge helix DNA binding protein